MASLLANSPCGACRRGVKHLHTTGPVDSPWPRNPRNVALLYLVRLQRERRTVRNLKRAIVALTPVALAVGLLLGKVGF